MSNNNEKISVRKTIKELLNNPDNKPLTGDPETMRNSLEPPEVYKRIHDEFRYPSIKNKKGGKKNKHKSNKRKSNKRKSNKRKSNKRKSNKHKYTVRRRRK